MVSCKVNAYSKRTHSQLQRFFTAGTKLRRLKSVIDANYIIAAFPTEYQDVHVIAGVLKSYLRGLPDLYLHIVRTVTLLRLLSKHPKKNEKKLF